MIRKICIHVLVILLLNGCTWMSEVPSPVYESAGRQSLYGLEKWAFDGRLAVVDDKDSVSVSIQWQHESARDVIELVGPLAQGRMKVWISPQGVEVDDGDSRKVYVGSVDRIFAEQLGVVMPAAALRFWVLGVEAPDVAVTVQPEGFYQSGWLVRYKEMQMVKDSLMPKKILVEKDKTRIKLIVDKWVCCDR